MYHKISSMCDKIKKKVIYDKSEQLRIMKYGHADYKYTNNWSFKKSDKEDIDFLIKDMKLYVER